VRPIKGRRTPSWREYPSSFAVSSGTDGNAGAAEIEIRQRLDCKLEGYPRSRSASALFELNRQTGFEGVRGANSREIM